MRGQVCAGVMCFLLAFASPCGFAGPPFFTDDPAPVDYHHWEFYLASLQEYAGHAATATLPHVEVNYGALQNVQLHLVAPMAYLHTSEGTHYGYAATEIGVKYRFVEETGNIPQIGTFPLVEIPTGDANLTGGKVQAYIPLWLQKSWGKFTTYGGGGFWYNPGPDMKNWTFVGWQAQYDFSDALSLGGELYFHTADQNDAQAGAAFNAGGFINIDANNHVLCSIGHSFYGEVATTAYLGYQYTL
jgi:hypothetical protein